MAISIRTGKILPKIHQMVQTQVEDVIADYEIVVDDILNDHILAEFEKSKDIDDER